MIPLSHRPLASVEGLQKMLDVCKVVSDNTEMEFNYNKCTCSVVGSASRHVIPDMKLGNDVICWSGAFKYLGIPFNTGNLLFVDTHVINVNFSRRAIASLERLTATTMLLN